MSKEKIKISEIEYRDDLYPRFDSNQQMIQKYKDSLESLPPIVINQENILIDGFHRMKAYQLAEKEEIPVEVINTKSEKHLKQLSYQYNSTHGLQLKNDEKKEYAQEMIGEQLSVKELAEILSVTVQTIQHWTKNQRGAQEKKQNRKIIELHLRAWNTQQDIVNQLNLPQKTISDKIKGFSEIEHSFNFAKSPKNDKSQEIPVIKKITKKIDDESSIGSVSQNWNVNTDNKNHSPSKPFRYNIWNIQKGNKTDHFGSFPLIFMENLLYYHTNLFDIVFDPFAGDGTTIDACKKWMRRYQCYDIKVKPGREKDIKQHNILQGLPDDLSKPNSKPDLVFLDPPYWILAKDKYSKENKVEEDSDSDSDQYKDDLGNMTLNEFRDAMKDLIYKLKQKKIKRIAYLIRPIWITETETWEWIDPMFEFYNYLQGKYDIEARYVIPYSTEQYNATMVIKAKEANKPLILNRELTIFKLKENG